MTATVHWHCDYCGSEDHSLLGDMPLGWWEVPGKGPHGGVGHACTACIAERESVRNDVIERRSAETARIVGGLQRVPDAQPG